MVNFQSKFLKVIQAFCRSSNMALIAYVFFTTRGMFCCFHAGTRRIKFIGSIRENVMTLLVSRAQINTRNWF